MMHRAMSNGTHPDRRRRAVGPRLGRLRARPGGLRRDARRRRRRRRAEARGRATPSFDLLILDIMMPGRSGLDLCRDVRGRSPVPIILLTAKDAEVDKVVGPRGRRRRLRDEAVLGARAARPGARPAAPPRARPQLATERGQTIEAGDVAIDLARHLVTVRGEPVNLTRSEFQVLRLLAERPGPGLQPPRDHGGAVAVRVPRRRARLRRPHLQPAPEDRARPPGPRARADGPRASATSSPSSAAEATRA